MYFNDSAEAIETLNLLVKSDDKIEKFSVTVMMNRQEFQVMPLGESSTHTAKDAIVAIETMEKMGAVTRVYFKLFNG